MDATTTTFADKLNQEMGRRGIPQHVKCHVLAALHAGFIKASDGPMSFVRALQFNGSPIIQFNGVYMNEVAAQKLAIQALQESWSAAITD